VSNTVKVTWNAVSRATSYSVYDSTTGASGSYSLYASGILTSSFTTAALPSGNYWFEVSASIGSNWVSANSNATAQRSIVLVACT
jgi:hypothetical protein